MFWHQSNVRPGRDAIQRACPKFSVRKEVDRCNVTYLMPFNHRVANGERRRRGWGHGHDGVRAGEARERLRRSQLYLSRALLRPFPWNVSVKGVPRIFFRSKRPGKLPALRSNVIFRVNGPCVRFYLFLLQGLALRFPSGRFPQCVFISSCRL